MRLFASYLIAAILLAGTMCVIVPLSGLGLPVGARSAVEQGPVQSVNRTHKGDRLIPAVGKSQPPPQIPTIMVGCEPAFSPLSASARANYSSRCMV